MVAPGFDNTPDHAKRMIDLAQDLRDAFDDVRARHQIDLGLRAGVHSGAAVAGVIGKQNFAYDL